MITTTFCKPECFCPYCKETGGEYGVSLTFYCFENPCEYPGRECMFVQNGGTRADEVYIVTDEIIITTNSISIKGICYVGLIIFLYHLIIMLLTLSNFPRLG